MIYIIKQEGLYQNKVTVSLASTIIVKWPIAAGYYSSPKTNRRHCLCKICLLYTSDAADEEDSVDLGGRRIIKKKR